MGCRTTMGLLPSLSYILSGGTPLSFGSFTCPLVPLPAAPPKRHGLGEALQKYFLHHHHHVQVLLEFPVDPLLPLPRWNEGSEVVVKLHV